MTDVALMRQGEKARIIDITGGNILYKRLESIGIRKGMELIKISSQLMKGPVTVRVNNTCVAIGYEMAKKIIVEVQSNRKDESIKKECK